MISFVRNLACSQLAAGAGRSEICPEIASFIMSFWKPGSKQRDQLQQSVQLNDEAIMQPLNHVTTLKIAPEKDVKTSLSKGVMTMKFMKRKADADLEAISAAEKRRKMLDSSWISEGSNRKTVSHPLNYSTCAKV